MLFLNDSIYSYWLLYFCNIQLSSLQVTLGWRTPKFYLKWYFQINFALLQNQHLCSCWEFYQVVHGNTPNFAKSRIKQTASSIFKWAQILTKATVKHPERASGNSECKEIISETKAKKLLRKAKKINNGNCAGKWSRFSFIHKILIISNIVMLNTRTWKCKYNKCTDCIFTCEPPKNPIYFNKWIFTFSINLTWYKFILIKINKMFKNKLVCYHICPLQWRGSELYTQILQAICNP